MAYLYRPGRRRPLRRHGRTFYITVLIFTLFACYSYLSGLRHDGTHHTEKIVARSLEARDLEVRTAFLSQIATLSNCAHQI